MFSQHKIRKQRQFHLMTNLLQRWKIVNAQYRSVYFLGLLFIFLENSAISVLASKLRNQGTNLLLSVSQPSSFLLGHLNSRAQNTFFNGKIKQKALDSAFTERTQRKVRGVLADSSRPLFCQFEPLSSWRRYRAPVTAGQISGYNWKCAFQVPSAK